MRKRHARFQFSLQDQMVGVAALSVGLGSFLFLGWTALAVPLYAVAVWLVREGKRDYRPGKCYAGYALAAASTLLFIAGMTMWMLFGRGPVFFVRDYPPVMAHIVGAAGISGSDGKVYCKTGVESEMYVARFHMTEAQLEKVAESVHIELDIGANHPDSFYEAFPMLWRPTPRLGQPSLSGEYSGGYLYATYDTTTKDLHVLWREIRAKPTSY